MRDPKRYIVLFKIVGTVFVVVLAVFILFKLISTQTANKIVPVRDMNGASMNNNGQRTVPPPQSPGDSTSLLIQTCPEAWYGDQMPKVIGGSRTQTNEYMIMNGKRVEMNQVDVAWVLTHCQVKKQSVF
ncbi:MAG: hypothetical protein NTX72_03080 [Candidatus Uhrbacteria bacterium]|nr:hypothetical protein [Candidatus Uhrbacteria bacterium]